MNYKLLFSDKYFTTAIWIMVFFVVLLQAIPQTESLMESILFSAFFIGFIFPPSTYLSRSLLPKAMKHKKINLFVVQFLICSLYIGIIFAANLYLFNYLEQKGVFPESYYFDISDSPWYSILILFSSGIFVNITMCGLQFLLEYIKSQKIIHEYQLRTLQHQFTPHFMFNVLNHIHTLMENDVEIASSLLIKYSEILRYQLYNGEKKFVKLKEEIQFMKDFIAVEEFRWDDKLTVAKKWDIEDENLEIPSLLFITFVENAFKHVSRSNLEKGFIDLDFKQRDKTINFEIKNSKSLIEKKKNQGGLGLKNIKDRLEILFSNQHILLIEETDSIFTVNLQLNLKIVDNE